jgi:hypothetical protein
MGLVPKAIWLENFSIVSMEEHSDTFLASYPRGIMFKVQVKEADLPHPWKSNPTLLFLSDLSETHTLRAAAACTDHLDENVTFDKIYRSCEKNVIGRGVKFPLIDSEFPIEYIVLVTFLAISGCIAILSDRIQIILDLPPATEIEPWILLDASSAVGKFIANAWVVALAATPWLLISVATAISALQTRVAGSTTSGLQDASIASLLFLGLVISFVLSISLLRRLISLRFARQVHLGRLAMSL